MVSISELSAESREMCFNHCGNDVSPMSASPLRQPGPLCTELDWREGSLSGHRCCSAEYQSVMRAWAMNTPGKLQKTVSIIGVWKGGIYAPGEVSSVSGARFLNLGIIGQGKSVERCFIYIVRGCRIQGDVGEKPDTYQGNIFFLGLIMGEPTLRSQVGRRGTANTCCPTVWGIWGWSSLTLL